MAEYIEREAAYEDFEKCNSENPKWTPSRVKTLIARQKDANVAPVRHGSIIETIEDGRMKRFFSCCGADFTEMTCWMTPKYCPNCGAKMDGGDEYGKDQSDSGGV